MRSRILRSLAVFGSLAWASAPAAALAPSVCGDPQPASFLSETLAFSTLETSVPESVAADLARRIHRIEKLTQRLAHDEGFLRSADEGTLLLLFNRNEGKDELLRSYAPSFAGSTPPDNLFQYLDSAIDLLWREIERLAPTYASTGGQPLMSTLENAVERRLRATVPKATYVGGMLREKEWLVRLSSLGLPESRSMSGVVFYRVPDQPWLICREFDVTQRYFDRDRAEKPGEITFGCMRLQA